MLSRNSSSKSESKRPSGRWVMQRVKGGISLAQGPNCNPLWRSLGFGCYWARMANARRVWKPHPPITHRCPSGAKSVIRLSSASNARIWCQTTSAWKLYFSRLALTFVVQKKDCRPDSPSFYATAVLQKSVEPHQQVPRTGQVQQLGSAGISPEQLLGQRTSCKAYFPPCEQQWCF